MNNRRTRVRQQFGAGLELPRDSAQDAMRRSENDRTQGNIQSHPSHPQPLMQNHPRPLMQINLSQNYHRPIRPSGAATPSSQHTPGIQQPFPTYSSAQAPRMYPPAQQGTTQPSQTVQRRMTPSENEDRREYMGQQSDTDDIQSQAVTQSNDRPPSYHQATCQPKTPLDARITQTEAAGTFADEMMDISSTGYRIMAGPQIAPVTAGAHLPHPYTAHQSSHVPAIGDHERERARENDRREDERIRRREEEDRRERERRRRDEEDRRSRREQYSSQRNTIPRPSHLMGANRKTAENTYDKVFKSKPGPKIQKAAYMLDVNKMKKNLLTQVLRLNIYSEEVKRKEGSNNLVNCWIAELNPGLFLLMKEKFLNRVYDEEFRVSGHRFILRRYEDKGAADGTVDTCRMRIIKVSSLETAYFHVYLTKAKVMLQAESMFDATQSLCHWLSEKLMKRMFHEMMGRSVDKIREINTEVLRWCSERTTMEKPIRKYFRSESRKRDQQRTDPRTKSESSSAFSTITRSRCADIYKTPERRLVTLQGDAGETTPRNTRNSSENSQNDSVTTRVPVNQPTSDKKSPRRKTPRTPGRELSPGTVMNILPSPKRFIGVPPGDNRDPFPSPITRKWAKEGLKEKRQRERDEKIEEEENWRKYREEKRRREQSEARKKQDEEERNENTRSRKKSLKNQEQVPVQEDWMQIDPQRSVIIIQKADHNDQSRRVMEVEEHETMQTQNSMTIIETETEVIPLVEAAAGDQDCPTLTSSFPHKQQKQRRRELRRERKRRRQVTQRVEYLEVLETYPTDDLTRTLSKEAGKFGRKLINKNSSNKNIKEMLRDVKENLEKERKEIEETEERRRRKNEERERKDRDGREERRKTDEEERREEVRYQLEQARRN